MTDLRTRMPAHALVEKVVSLRGTRDLRELPLGIVRPSGDAMAWIRGIRGEQEAARRLAALGPDWVVLHSIPIGEGESDVDHLAIGPTGVFVINSKRHIDKRIWVAGGRLLVDGQKTDHVRNSAYEATRVGAILQRAGHIVPVTAVVAISGAREITIKAPAEWKGMPVEVLPMRGLVRHIRRALATTIDVAAVAEVAADPATWSQKSLPSSDTAELVRIYNTIDRAVTRWRWLMLVLWALFMTAVIVVGFNLLGQLFTTMLRSLTP